MQQKKKAACLVITAGVYVAPGQHQLELDLIF